jgi:hypothetical protein
MASGLRTARAARNLREWLEPRGFDVLFDHGFKATDSTDAMGKIVAWFGDEYTRGTRLSELDIAVVARESNRAYVIVEIEENPVVPKHLLGDVLATMMGDRITFKRNRELLVGEWTTLLVFARSSAGLQHSRLKYLAEKINRFKSSLDTPNASIGRIIIATFKDEADLESILRREVESALAPSMER